MKQYSKEFLESKNQIGDYKISIEEIFQKLKEDKSIDSKCEGYGITKILDKDGECFVVIDGKEVSFEDLSGIQLKKKESYRGLIVLFIIITTLWSISGILLTYAFKDNGNSWNRGIFGDMFGSINALFSGLALGGIIYTILLQKKELKLQRHELKETRNEFKIQNETLKLQRFENTFFQMINLHHEIIDKLKFGDKERRVVFSSVHTILANYLSPSNTEIMSKYGPTLPTDNQEVVLKAIYDSLKNSHFEFYSYKIQNSLNHYYRNLYHIFKFIYTSDLVSLDKKKEYASMVRAQLSPSELFLIYYNCMIPNLGNPKLLFLVKEYNIIKNINPDIINNYLGHYQIFQKHLELSTNPFNKDITESINPFSSL